MTNNVGIFPDFASRTSNKKVGRPYDTISREHTPYVLSNLQAPPFLSVSLSVNIFHFRIFLKNNYC